MLQHLAGIVKSKSEQAGKFWGLYFYQLYQLNKK